ncbi:MAG TPA: hypothetical protein VFN67_17675 [Polyangiales bacterium]|nr:hypothetical protein [Polyangiales bacterium]
MRAAYWAILVASVLLVVGCATATPAKLSEQGAAGRETMSVDAGKSDDCRGPGRYEAGKEGSYKPCCAGLHEVQTRRYDASSLTCLDLPLRQYACVKGDCWDGVCEAGEQDPCGCAIDCPDSSPPAPEIDSSWKEVTTKCGYKFHAPADIMETQVQGTDSCVTQYDAGGCTFGGDYGFYSGSLESLAGTPGYVPTQTVIDAIEASIVTFGPVDGELSFQAGVHFPRLPTGVAIKLTLMARCKTEQARDMAVRVFRTLEFER